MLAHDPDERLLADTARSFVQSELPLTRARALRTGDDPALAASVWFGIAELGWLGVDLPERFGGSALGLPSAAILFEEIGRAAVPHALLSTVALSGTILSRHGSEDQQAEWLPRLASGKALVGLAHQEAAARFDVAHVEAVAERTKGGFRITGQKSLAIDAPAADALLVSARHDGIANAEAGVSLFLIPRSGAKLTLRPQRLIDGRAAADLELHEVQVSEADVVGSVGGGIAIVREVADRATVCLCAEMVGGMQHAFDLTIAYLREREQFGVKIGTFQALQHRAARMFISLTLARPTVRAAALAEAAGGDEFRKAVSQAKAICTDAFFHIANEAIQMHGGIGMTEEHGVGHYLRVARVAEMLFGDANWHRARWAELSGY